jgi:predicted Rdx family selenoprotein
LVLPEAPFLVIPLFSHLRTFKNHTGQARIFHIHILTLSSPSKFAQELLSTFSTSLGEVALQPSTGGTFVVHLYTRSDSGEDAAILVQKHLLWDRKAEGGFPGIYLFSIRSRSFILFSRSGTYILKAPPSCCEGIGKNGKDKFRC